MVPLLEIVLRGEGDVVLARQSARRLAEALRFGAQDQARIASAVSEIARNAQQYAGEGRVQFELDPGSPACLWVQVADRGPGIAHPEAVLDGRAFHPREVPGLGWMASRKLMDHFEVQSSPGEGTTVRMGKRFSPSQGVPDRREMAQIRDGIVQLDARARAEELALQQRELVHALEQLSLRESDLMRLNRELEETNRGVVALYAELEEKAEALRRASELKSRFLSNMSHEFRTPLNSIHSLSRLLLTRADGDLTSEQERQVAFILKSAEALTEIINDLLDLAKIEAGKSEVKPKEVEVAELFATLRGMMRPLLTREEVALFFEPPAGVPPLFTDEGKLAQILRNFISNAIKFTERGEVRVAAAVGPEGMVCFSVSDTGIGIAPEHQERIFEEFSQVEGPLHRAVKGTGLGLPLSRKLAALLGGRLELRSSPGVGSTFYAILPALYAGDKSAPRAVSERWTQRPRPERRRALIIDDDEVSRYLLRRRLEQAHWDVEEAGDGVEGLRRAAAEVPEIIFLDVVMPQMDGFEVVRALRASPETAAVPVVIHSSQVLDERDRSRLGHGVEFFSKEAGLTPDGAAKLREILAKADPRPGSKEAARA